jgi:beta-glucosidase
MSAYNRINGVYASENDACCCATCSKKWGYDGMVMSDWYGTYSDNVPGGALDLEMPGPARWMDPEKNHGRGNGDLDEATLTTKCAACCA